METTYKQLYNTAKEDMKSWTEYNDVYQRWRSNKIMKIINSEYKLQLHSSGLYKRQEELARLEAHILKSNLWCWLTISPKLDVQLDVLKKILAKYSSRSIIKKYIYVIEQRGSDEAHCGDGIHAHLLLERNLKYPPNKFIKNSKNSFKKILDVKKEQFFYYFWLQHSFLTDKIDYMLGKKNESKHLKQTFDLVFREKNDIKKYYSNFK